MDFNLIGGQTFYTHLYFSQCSIYKNYVGKTTTKLVEKNKIMAGAYAEIWKSLFLNDVMAK
jgi:hypothetical protein